jgi:hypothetical protein
MIDGAILITCIIFGYALYPYLNQRTISLAPTTAIPKDVSTYLVVAARDIEGRLDLLFGYYPIIQQLTNLPQDASIERIHAKVSEIHRKGGANAVCRHFAPLLFIVLVESNYIRGVRLHLGYMETFYISTTIIEGKKIIDPNHIWVEINGTIYEPENLRLSSLTQGRNTYVEWGAQIIDGKLTLWTYLVADLVYR